jgi:transposase
MFTTPTTPPEVHIRALRQEAQARQVLERAAGTSLKRWEAPLAYLLGAAVAGMATSLKTMCSWRLPPALLLPHSIWPLPALP